jgi:hypothetical protein
VLLVAACGAKPPPESLENLETKPQRAADPVRHAIIRMARPDIDVTWALPDFHDDLRWPLTGMNHPVLEPRFEVAQRLAMPGIGWEELCSRGVQNRVSATQKELLSYLRGWCEVQKRNVDGACAQLKPLFGSITLGLTAAVRQDFANILVEQGDADGAEHWLTKHDIRDTPLLDLLAANYVEVGSSQDAFKINRRAIDSDSHANAATQCRRLVRRIKLEQEANPALAIEELKILGRTSKVSDPICERLYNKVECSLAPATDCLRFIYDERLPESTLHLLAAYFNWPYEGYAFQWTELAHNAMKALPNPGAAELIITAYEAASLTDALCIDHEQMQKAIASIRLDATNAIYEPRLRSLELACAKAPPKSVSPPGAPPPKPVAKWPASPAAP